MRRSVILLTCAGAFVASCAKTSTRSLAWSTTVDTLPDGARHVVNTPPSPGAVPRFTLHEELRIGSAGGSGPTSFGQIKGLAVLSDGRIAVLDAMARQVRIFSASGKPLATFGRDGEGPGEFKAPLGLMRDSKDRLWVPDHQNARISVFDASKGFVTSYPWKVRSFAWIWRGAMMKDGRIEKPSVTLGPPRRQVLRVWDSTMTAVDSLPLPTPPGLNNPPGVFKDSPGFFAFHAPGGRAGGYMQIPYYAQPQTLLDPRGGVWSTSSGDPSYRIAYWTPGGDTTLVLQTRRPPVSVSGAGRDSAIARVQAQLKRFRASPEEDWSKIPTVEPAIESMFLSDGGDLWVRARVPGGTVFDRYARDGTHVATVSSPPLHLVSQLAPVVRGDHFWAAVTDGLGVDYVVRDRIVPEAGGSAGS